MLRLDEQSQNGNSPMTLTWQITRHEPASGFVDGRRKPDAGAWRLMH